MRPFRAAVLAALVLAPPGIGLAAERAPGAAADGPRAVRVAPADPTSDDAGVFIWDRWGDCAVAPRISRDVVSHGPPTGDPEEDSLEFGVAGHDGCATDDARRAAR